MSCDGYDCSVEFAALRARLAAAERERDAAANVIADMCSERRGSGVTEAEDEETASERIAARLTTNSGLERERDALRAQLAAAEKDRDKWKAAYEIEDRQHMCALARENEREVERDDARAQLAAVEKERDALYEAANEPPYVDCVCPGCTRKVPQRWVSGMCQTCCDEDCDHDGREEVSAMLADAIDERDDAVARVAELEAALEPTAAKVSVSDEQWKRCTHLDDGPMQRGTVCWTCTITAIRARAGLTKEGK